MHKIIMASGLIVKWHLDPPQPPKVKTIILPITFYTNWHWIWKQAVRQLCNEGTYKRFWCMLFGSSGFQWCSMRRTGTSTRPNQRSSPPAVWWCQLSPAWLAALAKQTQEEQVSAGLPSTHLTPGKEWEDRKYFSTEGTQESANESPAAFWVHLELNWQSNFK